MNGKTDLSEIKSKPILNERLTWNQVTAVDRWLAKKILDVAGQPEVAIQLWNGERFHSNKPAVGRFSLSDRRALISLALNPELNFGDLYMSGRLNVDIDMASFIEAVYRSYTKQDNNRNIHKKIIQCFNRPRPNTLSGSSKNIHKHYDIGNDFYKLWLDKEAMQYTCAYYPDPAMTLEQAQIAKLHHVCKKLQLQPGESVVEAGCGWGGLARFMAREYGAKVKSYNISKEQIAYARQKAKEEGLDDRVEYFLDDYRNIKGKFDVFVSIGMLEHVGKDNYHNLGTIIDRVLKPNGRGLIHSIGRSKPQNLNVWIEKHIFPGAYAPTIAEMMKIFEPWSFSILDIENLRLHYARTLEHWLERFEQHLDEIRAMFDDPFIRAWRLYLASSIAAFQTSELQLFQVLFTRPMKNDIPSSRAHIYDDASNS